MAVIERDKKMNTKKILEESLFSRTESIAELLNSAKLCIEEGDLFQAAVRIQMVENFTKFDDVTLRVLESESEKVKTKP